MRALDVFRARHQFAREIFFADLYADWNEKQLRTPPHPTMNSLAWVLWHIARVEDAGVARFVLKKEQVLSVGSWNDRMNIDVEHYGYGSSREEMLHISQTVDLDALQGYFYAVGDTTLGGLDMLTPETLDEVLNEDEVQQVMFTEGVALPHVTNVVSVYSGWTRLEALYHFSVTHYYWHGGEVRTLEGVLRGA